MKYGLLWSAEDIVQQMNMHLDKRIYSTGIVNWPRVFDGQCYRARRIDPNQFDVVHVQLSGDTTDMIRDVRSRIKGETKLVINPDYSINFWNHYGVMPEVVVECFRMADFVFGQCQSSAELLSEILHREIPLIPHPLDTKWLNNHAIPAVKRSGSDVVINSHRDGQHHTPYFMTREHRDIVTHLIGFMGNESGRRDVVNQYYDHIHKIMPNADLIDKMYRNAFCIIDHYTHNVQGRSTMQAAALGVPCLGWDCVDAQIYCYPELTSQYGDLAHQIQLFRRLREDEDFVATVSAEAMKSSEVYSFDSCEKLFTDMLSGNKSGKADSVTDVTDEHEVESIMEGGAGDANGKQRTATAV